MRRLLQILLYAVTLYSLFPLTLASATPEMVIVQVYVNEEDKGTVFALLEGDAEVWLEPNQVRAMGMVDLATPESKDNQHVSLHSLSPAVRYTFDQNLGTLRLTVDPMHLASQTSSLLPQQAALAPLRDGDSAYLNYAISGIASNRDSISYRSSTFDVGIRKYGLLMLNRFNNTLHGQTLTRQSSQFIWDDPANMRRWTLGDHAANAGEQNSTSMIGLNVASALGMQPGKSTHPNSAVNYVLATPSEVTLLVNGVQVMRQHFAAGPLNLENVPMVGSGEVELIIRDAFGREQRVIQPFYRSYRLLAPGLHQYSYSLGLPASNLLSGEPHYRQRPMWIAYDRMGVTDRLTLGLSSQFDGQDGSVGLSGDSIVGNMGEIRLGGYLSLIDGRLGWRIDSLMTLRFNEMVYGSIFIRPQSSAFGFATDQLASTTPQQSSSLDYAANLFVRKAGLGLVSGSYSSSRQSSGGENRKVMLSGSTTPFQRTKLNVNVSWRWNSLHRRSQRSAQFALSHYLKNGLGINLSIQTNSMGKTSGFLGIQLSPPVSEGYGYRMTMNSDEKQEIASETQWDVKGQHANFSLTRAESPNSPAEVRGSLQGALVYLDGRSYATRPVSDAFALMRVGLADIRVQHNGNDMGRSNEQGEVLIPSLASYGNNKLSLNASDAPIGYSYSQQNQTVRLPFHAGLVVEFKGKHMQAVEGKIIYMKHGKPTTMNYARLRVSGEHEKAESMVGDGGMFYLNNLVDGQYRAEVTGNKIHCNFLFELKSSTVPVVDLGEMLCE